MDPDKIDEVRMAVHEAFINASEHSQAPDRRVYVIFRLLGEAAPESCRSRSATPAWGSPTKRSGIR